MHSNFARKCFTTHKPTLALTLSERASSYYNALDNARIYYYAQTRVRFNALGESWLLLQCALDNARIYYNARARIRFNALGES